MAENVVPQPVASGANRRALVFLAIGVALVLLVLAAKMFTGGSGSDSSGGQPTPNPLAVTAAPAGNPPGATAARSPGTTVPAQPVGPAPNTTRDPFQPLR